jgi:hypothetical protein
MVLKLETKYLFTKYGQMGPNSLNAYSAWGNTNLRTALLMGTGSLFVAFEGDAMVLMIDVSKPLLRYGIARLLEEVKTDKIARKLVKYTLGYHIGKIPIEELSRLRKKVERRAKREQGITAETKNKGIDPRSEKGLALRGCSLNPWQVAQATLLEGMEFNDSELMALMHQHSDRFYKRLQKP